MTPRDGVAYGSLPRSIASPFDRNSPIRQIVGEPILSLLYQRALVMDVAHPKIGAAVADHSRFREQPLRRLWATWDAALRLVFGGGSIARGAAVQIYRFHDHVNGEVDGATYTAHDASLLLWVWATLVDTCDVAFTRWIHPYGAGEADAFYRDMRAFARFFGVPGDIIPPDRPSFAVYLDAMLDGDELATTDTSHGMVTDLLWFRRWFTPAPAMRALRVLNVATLDTRLIERFHLGLDADDLRLFERIDRSLAAHYCRLPAWRTRLPYGYLAVRRISLPRDGARPKGRRHYHASAPRWPGGQ